MGRDGGDFHFELSVDWLMTGLEHVWQPFLLGCLVSAIVASVTGYLAIRFYWRHHVIKEWRKRQQKRSNKS